MRCLIVPILFVVLVLGPPALPAPIPPHMTVTVASAGRTRRLVAILNVGAGADAGRAVGLADELRQRPTLEAGGRNQVISQEGLNRLPTSSGNEAGAPPGAAAVAAALVEQLLREIR